MFGLLSAAHHSACTQEVLYLTRFPDCPTRCFLWDASARQTLKPVRIDRVSAPPACISAPSPRRCIMAYPHQLYPCAHQFCGACLHKHLAARLTCPKPGCGCVTQPACSTARCVNPAISRSPSCASLLVLTCPARHCMPSNASDAVLCTCISHSCTAISCSL